MLRAGHDVSYGETLHQDMYFETRKQDRKENKIKTYHETRCLTVLRPVCQGRDCPYMKGSERRERWGVDLSRANKSKSTVHVSPFKKR